MNLASRPDIDADAAQHDYPCPSCQAMNDLDANYCDMCGKSLGQSATVTVDDTTGIPGEEFQFSAQDLFERRRRELELEELALL